MTSRWFKILSNEGKSCHGGDFTWSLPRQDDEGNWIPGDWHVHEGSVVLCRSGFHITDCPIFWRGGSVGTIVYECEIAEDAELSEYDKESAKMAVSKLRLTKVLSGAFVNTNGTQLWYQNGKLHRDNDLPAVIYPNGNQEWYQNGKIHRDDDLPAVMCANGNQEWYYQNGKIHRDNDRPAGIYADGTQMWYQNGKLHRDNDLPALIRAYGTQMWYQNGKLHRDNDLPAVICAYGTQIWYRDGKMWKSN